MKIYARPLAVSVKNPKVPYWWKINSGKCWLNINFVNHKLLLQIYVKDAQQTFLVTLPKRDIYRIMMNLKSINKITGNDSNKGKWYVSKEQLVAMLQSKHKEDDLDDDLRKV